VRPPVRTFKGPDRCVLRLINARNPEFVALAGAHGLGAWRVAATADFDAAREAARAHPRPALIELATSMGDISPGRRPNAAIG
jgi:thiamine pyrophosphate-dependent acetolactate synthase large subunit-like protein